MNPTAANLALDPVRLEKTRADRLLNLGGALASGGIALSALAGVVAPQRFAHAYLVAFTFTTTLCLGGLFFVIIQHLTRAGWSVTVRRQMEWLASFLPVCALLFLPVVLFRERLYHAWMSPEAAGASGSGTAGGRSSLEAVAAARERTGTSGSARESVLPG